MCAGTFYEPRSRGQYPRRCPEHRDQVTPEQQAQREQQQREARERRVQGRARLLLLREAAQAEREAHRENDRRDRLAEQESEKQRRAEERRLEAEERRAERERERDRERRQRVAEQRAEHMRAEREKKAERMRTEKNKRRLAPLWESDRQVVLLNETLEASRRAGDLEPISDRHALAHQVRQVARAQGTDGLRDAYLDLAAAALRAAANVPTAGLREPDPAAALAA